jgi:serine/threonine-protein kinase RsbW
MLEKIGFHVVNRLSELEKVTRIVQEIAERNGLSSGVQYHINLALDEVISNIIAYGYGDDEEHLIYITLSLEQDVLTVEVEDDGCPFSMPDAPQVDVQKPLAERPVGGLGCHLIKRLMDEVRYSRRQGRNRLVMRKRIDGDDLQE